MQGHELQLAGQPQRVHAYGRYNELKERASVGIQDGHVSDDLENNLGIKLEVQQSHFYFLFIFWGRTVEVQQPHTMINLVCKLQLLRNNALNEFAVGRAVKHQERVLQRFLAIDAHSQTGAE